MWQRNLDYLVIAVMLVSGLYTAITGLAADLFGLPQFAFHRCAGYVCAASVVGHLVLNWGRIVARLRRWLRWSGRGREPALSPREGGVPVPSRRGFLLTLLAALGGFALGRLGPPRPEPEDADLGLSYHEWSKPGASGLVAAVLDWGPRPDGYRTYADAPRVTLPDPYAVPDVSLAEAIQARRSVRDYASRSLSMEELSTLLHAAQGITQPRTGFRAAPSAGALYPLETYTVVHDVAGLEAGLYHYAVHEHRLELLQPGDLRPAVTRAGLWQPFLGQAGVCLILAAVFQRTRWRYRERTYRYVMLEAGHVAQNIYLAATAIGLGACAVGAFDDNDLNDLLGLDGRQEAAVYLISVGTTS